MMEARFQLCVFVIGERLGAALSHAGCRVILRIAGLVLLNPGGYSESREQTSADDNKSVTIRACQINRLRIRADLGEPTLICLVR